MSQCKGSTNKPGCGAEIIWCITDKNHKPIPINPEPHPDGVWIKVRLDDNGDKIVHRLLMDEMAAQNGLRRYKSHWETCPYAKEHKKK